METTPYNKQSWKDFLDCKLSWGPSNPEEAKYIFRVAFGDLTKYKTRKDAAISMAGGDVIYKRRNGMNSYLKPISPVHVREAYITDEELISHMFLESFDTGYRLE
jgi:hypothetical protein